MITCQMSTSLSAAEEVGILGGIPRNRYSWIFLRSALGMSLEVVSASYSDASSLA